MVVLKTFLGGVSSTLGGASNFAQVVPETHTSSSGSTTTLAGKFSTGEGGSPKLPPNQQSWAMSTSPLHQSDIAGISPSDSIRSQGSRPFGGVTMAIIQFEFTNPKWLLVPSILAALLTFFFFFLAYCQGTIEFSNLLTRLFHALLLVFIVDSSGTTYQLNFKFDVCFVRY